MGVNRFKPIGVASSLVFAGVLAWFVGSSECVSAQSPATSATTVPAVTSLANVADPYVLIMSIDGLRPDCLLRADSPNLRRLMDRGSFSLWARTTDVAVTTPSHVSMLTGVVLETHGINFNGDPPDDARIAVPTLFDIAKQAGLSTGVVSGKRKFSIFTMTGAVDFSTITTEPVCKDNVVGAWAADMIVTQKPRVMFVHFAGADTVGHATGWGTAEQLKVIGEIDQQVDVVLKAYETAGLTDRLYVIISADHGGTMRSHGKDDIRSRYIPWISVGPGIRENYDLTRLGKEYEIRTYDTFATACGLLGLPTPPGIDGKPVTTMFEEFDLMAPVAPVTPATQPAETTTQPAATLPVISPLTP